MQYHEQWIDTSTIAYKSIHLKLFTFYHNAKFYVISLFTLLYFYFLLLYK